MARALAASLAAAGTDLQAFLTALNPAWNLVGRVHFNLAENRRDPDRPFAFLATYTTRLSAQAKAQHVPLGQALREYAGAANRDKLLSLLLPVQRAAEHCRLAEADGRCRARSSIRCAGDPATPRACCTASPSWKAPASSCACPRPGAPAVPPARR